MYPLELEKLIDDWRQEVSNKLNDQKAELQRLEEIITPQLAISETALAVALWLVEQSEDGLTDHIELDPIIAGLPEIEQQALEEACYELEHLEFVSC